MGMSYKDNPQTEAARQVFSQLAGVGQGAHVLSAVVFSKRCRRSNTYQAAQKTRKGKAVCGAGKRRREGELRETVFPSSQLQFYSVQSYPQLGRFRKPSKAPGPWLAT